MLHGGYLGSWRVMGYRLGEKRCVWHGARGDVREAFGALGRIRLVGLMGFWVRRAPPGPAPGSSRGRWRAGFVHGPAGRARPR